MKRTWMTRVVAIASITVMEGFALYLGHNGLLLTLAVATVAGIAGFEIGAQHVLRAVDRGEDPTDS